ncbi:MAG: Ig-like domain-containing protein, partial [Candidatus Obscuribacterales bacterium]|nr:Ig-like domain-containing protein [Candidatus Obscuribacterales bacterium]
AQALQILGRSHEGLCTNFDQLTITFSQPMVSIKDTDSNSNLKESPVQINPLPPGRWRWLGTQQLRFEPTAKRFPRSTKYSIKIPRTIKSVFGNSPEEDIDWTVTTSSARLSEYYPYNYSAKVTLNPLIALAFDQQINSSDLIQKIHIKTKSSPDKKVVLATN